MYATGLKCLDCGAAYPTTEKSPTCSKCQGLFEIEYDHDEMRKNFQKSELKASRTQGVWRYGKALPVRKEFKVTLEEGSTPLVETSNVVPGIRLFAKLDYVMPTSSFKDRGATVIVSKARELGVTSLAIDSSGNAAASLAAYASKAGIKCYAFVPSYTDTRKIVQISAAGAKVIKVKGTRTDTHEVTEAAYKKFGWYYCGFMVSPYATAGSKTIAYEVCEQLEWNPPDWIALPVGTGSGILGCYNGLTELAKLGWINKVPKLICVQPNGCAPIASAQKDGAAEIAPVMTPTTIAEGLSVGSPAKGRLVLEALKNTGGLAEVVTDQEILQSTQLLASKEGLFVEVSSAASAAGISKLVKSGVIRCGETVVCILTGTGLKSHKEYTKFVPEPIEIEPRLESLDQHLKPLQ